MKQNYVTNIIIEAEFCQNFPKVFFTTKSIITSKNLNMIRTKKHWTVLRAVGFSTFKCIYIFILFLYNINRRCFSLNNI